jgi:hypothetical protein
MARSDTKYYIAAGRSLEAVEDYKRKAEAHLEMAHALVGEIGADGVYRDGNRICGFGFPEGMDLPPGFRWERQGPGKVKIAVPHKGRKEGKAIAARMEEAPHPHSWDFNIAVLGKPDYFLGPDPFGRGMRTGFVGFEELGDDIVLKVPVPDEGRDPAPVPFDATPLKRSDYWARKEAEEASA